MTNRRAFIDELAVDLISERAGCELLPIDRLRVTRLNRGERLAVAVACKARGHTNAAIAELLGIHGVSVLRLLTRHKARQVAS